MDTTIQFRTMSLIKDKVKLLLERQSHLRDSDEKLIATYWYYEVGESIEQMGAMPFLRLYSERKLTSAESIRRVRCKIMEQNPKLRGETYIRRTQDGNQMKSEIHDL